MPRVRIGTCRNPADAALVRAAFEAHQIPIVINAEQHASMLGGLGGAFVPLHIFVDDQHAEEAAELLRDLREQDHAEEARQAEAVAEEDDPADDDAAELIAARADRRRRIGILLLIFLGGAFAAPFVIDRPVLATGLVVAFFGLLGIALFGSRKQPTSLPRARVTRHKPTKP